MVISDAPPAAPSFPSCRKRRGRKGALGYGLVLPASEFGQEPMFRASFHTVVTLRASDYAPPDTGVSDLKLVAVERLPSIEGAVENLMNVTFLRGPCRGRCPHRPEGQYEFVGDHRKTSASCTGGAEPRPYRVQNKYRKLPRKKVQPDKLRLHLLFTADIQTQLFTNLMSRIRQRVVRYT